MTLTEIQSAAAQADGGPYKLIPAVGPTSGPYVSYVLCRSSDVPDGYTLHVGGGHTVSEWSAIATSGSLASAVSTVSNQQVSRPTDVVYG